MAEKKASSNEIRLRLNRNAGFEYTIVANYLIENKKRKFFEFLKVLKGLIIVCFEIKITTAKNCTEESIVEWN